MSSYKASQYNFFFPYPKDPSQTVAYNTRSGAIALMENEKYEIYRRFEEKGEEIPDADLLNDLQYGGYVVDRELDELAQLRYETQRARHSTSVLSMTIAPTSDCNFRCVYCYEKDSIRPVTMTRETKEKLLDFIGEQLPCYQKLMVTWYGGEPLLAMDIVEELSKRLITMCDEQHKEYEAAIITNGYLLDLEKAKKLRELQVKDIQITLDGDKEDHDKRRFLKGGKPTFQTILDNLTAAKDEIVGRVAIRINADRHNIDRVDNVVRALKERGLSEITAPYLAMVDNENDTYNDNFCFHASEFSDKEFEFIRRNGLDFLAHIPIQTYNYCGADADYNYVVGADGLLYKCWCEIGQKENSVGSVSEGLRIGPRFLNYLLYDATVDPNCSQCKYLPICMGGCPFKRINKTSRCPAIKHGLAAFMNVIPELLDMQLREAEEAAKQNENM